MIIVISIIGVYIAVMCLISTCGWLYERYIMIPDPMFGRPGLGELIAVYWVNAICFPYVEIRIFLEYWLEYWRD